MVFPRVRRALPALALGVVLAQCGKDSSGPGTPVPAAIAAVSGNNQTDTVGQNLPLPLVVKVSASDGRGVPNVSVTWAVTAGGGSLTSATSLTDASGLASVTWSLGTTAGPTNQTAQASIPGLSGSPVTFTATAVAAAPSQIALVSGNNQSGTVGQGLGAALVVRVADPFNNPVNGLTVSWAIASGGGALSSAATATNAQGQATVTWTLGPTAGAQTVTATTPGLTGSPVGFTAQAAAGAATQIALVSGNAQSGAAGQQLGAPLVVITKDAFGNAKSGVSVSWAVTAGGGAVAVPSVITDAQGQASVAWTLGTAAGSNNNTATASVAGLTGSPVTFTASTTPGVATQLTLVSGDNQTAAAGQALALPLVVKVADQFGNGVAGTNVSWAVTVGGGSVGAAASASDAQGQASIAWTVGTGVGPQSATATVAGLSGSPVTFSATATAAAAAQLALVSGDAQTGTAGAALANPFLVKVSDAFGNPVAGVAVSWAVTAGAGSILPAAPATDAAGLAQATLTLGPGAGASNNAVMATATGLTGSPVTFTASAGPATASQLALVSGDGQSAVVGQTLAAPLVVKVTDPFNNPVAGTAVSWSVTGGGGAVSSGTVSTDAAGLASVTWTLGGAAGAQTAQASVGGLTGSPVTFSATGTAAAAATIALVSGDGQSATVGTALAGPFVVRVTDAFDNPVAGVAVAWAVTAGAGSIAPLGPTTDGSGQAQATLTLGPTTGLNTATATAAGLAGSPVSFSGTGSAAAAAQIAVESGDAQTGTVGATLANTFVVKVTDAFGNPVAGTTVSWSVTAGGGSIAPLSGNTNLAGLAAATLTLGTAAGPQGAQASAGGLTGSPVTFAATAVADTASQVALASGDGQTGSAGAAVAQPIVVRVADQFGNPVAGVAVAFAVTTGGGSVSAAADTSDTQGLAAVTWTLGGSVGTQTAVADAGTLGGSPITFTATATAGAAAQIAAVSGESQTGTVGTALSNPFVVLVTDAFGNPVSGASVVWAVSLGGGSITPAAPTTDAFGHASATLTLGTGAGPDAHQATATSGSLSGSPVLFSANAAAGAATQMVLVSGDGQTATAGAVLAQPLVVVIRDQFGNPVDGVTVTWTASDGALSSGSTPSDSAGEARVTWTLGGAAGSQTAHATVGGLIGSPVDFTATATTGSAAAIALVSGDGQSGTVAAALGVPVVVKVTDALGNPVAGTTVTWVVTAGGGGIAPSAPTTDGAGLASATWTLGTVAGAGNNTVTASASGLAGSPVMFTASAAAGAAAQVAFVSGSGQSGTVGTTLASPFVVRVTDSFGNPVAGSPVTWSTSAVGGAIAPTATNTNTAGLAQATLTLGTVAGAARDTALATAGSLSGSPVAFTADAVADAETQISVVSGNGQTDTVGFALPASLVVLVQDQHGNPVPNVSVAWSVTDGGGSVSSPSSLTDAAGHAAVTWTVGPVAGAPQSAEAGVPGLLGTPVSFSATTIASHATQIAAFAGDSQAGTAGAALPQPFTVVVSDTYGNAVANESITWLAATGGGSIAPTTNTTDAQGHASATLTLGAVAGANSGTATATGLTGSPVTFAATGNSAAATTLALVSGNAQSDTVGRTLADSLVVVVTDGVNPVAGVSVGFAVTSGGGSVSAASAVTDGAGHAFVKWTLGGAAGPQAVAASAGGLSGSPVTFTATALAGAASQISRFSGNNQSGTAGSALASAFVVKVSDAFGNGVAGLTVNWAVTGGGGSIAASSITDGSGHAAATLTLGTAAGTNNNTVTASAGGLAGSPVGFTASAAAGAASQLVDVSGNGQTGAAGAALASAFVVKVTDAFGNAKSGVSVSWAVATGGGAVSSASGITNSVGQASTTLTLGTAVGINNNSVTATSAGLTGSPATFTASATAGAAATIALSSGNGQSATVNTALASPFVVLVTDAFGNPVPGITVTWAVTAGGGSIGASSMTDALGHASQTLTLGTAAGASNNTATAAVGGLGGSPVTFTASAAAAAAATLALVSGNGQTGTVHTALASPFVVKVTDAFNNPVSGYSVSWAATGGGGSIAASSLTNGAGQASATLTLGTAAGASNNSATASGSGLAGSPVTFTASATAGAAKQIALVSGNNQTGTVGTALASPFVVAVTDSFGNAKSGITVFWAKTGPAGSAISPSSAITNLSGQASATLTLGTVAGTGNHTATATASGLTGSPVGFTASAAAGAAAAVVRISGNNQSGTVGQALGAPFVVRVSDAFGNHVPNVTVTWAVTGGGGSIPGSSLTDTSGAAAATLTLGNTAGTNNNTAIATVAGASGSPISFTASAAAGAAAAIAGVSGNSQTGTVNSTLVNPFVVVVTDQFGNPKAGETVNWAVTGGGGSIVASALTNSSGQSSATLTLGTTAGSNNNVVTATMAGLTGSPITFTASATAGAAATLALVSGDAQSGTVNQALASPFVVRVTDAFGNGVPSYPVSWAVTSGGGAIPASSLTNASGQASAALTLGTVAGTSNNAATATTSGLTGSPVTFTASAAAGAAANIALVSGNAQSGTVNQALASPYVVHVTDAFGNDKAGYSVSWAVTGGGGSIPASAITNALGQASATRTLGTVAGTSNNTAQASGSGLTGSPVTFTATANAGAAATLSLVSGNNQSGTVNQVLAAPFTVRVTDAFNNGITGYTVNWAVTGGGGAIAASSLTGPTGQATATLTLGTTAGAGNNTATATTTGLTGSPITFTASASAGPAATIALVSGNGQTGTVNQALASAFVVHVADAFGNSVSGYSVSWAATAGGGSIAASSITGGTGNASATLTLGTTAGTSNNTASASGTGLTGSPVTFTASATAGAAAQIAAVSGNGQAGSVNAALAAPFVVLVTDAFGNPKSGVTVNWVATAGGGSIAPPSGASDVAGHASATLTLGAVAGAGKDTATATATGLAGSPVVFVASANASAATQISLVSGNGQTDTVGHVLSVPLTVLVRDASDNPVSGFNVGWSIASGGGSVSQGSVATDVSGLASVTWTLGTAAGAQSAQASAGGLTGSPVTFSATGLAAAASQIALISGNGQTGTVDQSLAAAFVVKVTDAFGNPVAGRTVTWAATGGGGVITPASPTTDAAGLATASLKLGTAAGTNNNTVTATATGLTGSPVTFTASAGAAAATQVIMISGDAQSGNAGAALAAPLVVEARDAFANPVASVPVTWGVTGGGGGLSGSSVPTNTLGRSSVTWTLGAVAGPNSATATSASLAGSPVTFSATGNPGNATQIARISGNAQTGTVNTGLTDSLVVKVTDSLGNPVAGQTVTWAATAGGGTIVPAAPTTNALGLAWARLTLGTVAGVNKDTVTATATGLTGSPIAFVASATAAAASQISLNAGNSQTGLAGTALATALAVLVRDPFNNPVAGVSVSWAATTGGGSVSAPTSSTNASGIATITRTLGPSAGTDSTTATAGGLTGSPVGFTATATPNATISGTISTTTGFLAPIAATPLRLAPSDATAVTLPTSTAAFQVRQASSTVVTTAAAPVSRSPVQHTPEYTPDELIVTYRAAALAAPPAGSRALASPAVVQSVGDGIRARLAAHIAGGRVKAEGVSPVVLSARIRVSDPSQLDAVKRELEADPAVAAVSRNALVYADATTPNDPYYPYQAWDAEMLDLPRAWSITTGSSTVIVAVVDDGIRGTHPALAGNLSGDGWDFVNNNPATDSIPKCSGPGKISNANDGNGYDNSPNIPSSWTYNSVSSCVTGPNTIGGHGLHVAGTIGAVGNDGVGTAGVAWTVKIRPVRVLGVAGIGNTYDVAQGVLYAAGLPADNGSGGTVTAPSAARVINLSLAGPVSDTTLHLAVISATNNGSLVVAAAGNDGTSAPNYPAAYPEALSVTAVGPDGLLASYSSFGSTVDIAAPGGDMGDATGGEDPATFGIVSSQWNFISGTGVYTALQGTSMAAPHVSGVAALLLAQTPSLTVSQLRSRLESYAVDAGAAGRDDQYGNGIVNARNALTQSFAPPAQLYARLYDTTTGAIIQTVPVAGNGTYAFTAVGDGAYYVFAGEDQSGDAQIGIPGRRWGAFGGSTVPTVVPVNGAGIYSRSFSIGLPIETESNDDVSSPDWLVVGGYANATADAFQLEDIFRLRIPTLGTYTIETSGQHGACGFALEDNTTLSVFDSTTALVASNDDIDGATLNFCSKVTLPNLAPGLYYVDVQGLNAHRYRVQVRAGS